jgi:diacylglycerol kinase family enzyme
VLFTLKPAISRDVLSTPQSTLADGYLTLQFIRIAGGTRMNLAKAFLNLSDGSHLNYDFVECLKVRAFRIVPDGTEGNIMIDGEKVPYGKLK